MLLAVKSEKSGTGLFQKVSITTRRGTYLQKSTPLILILILTEAPISKEWHKKTKPLTILLLQRFPRCKYIESNNNNMRVLPSLSVLALLSATFSILPSASAAGGLRILGKAGKGKVSKLHKFHSNDFDALL